MSENSGATPESVTLTSVVEGSSIRKKMLPMVVLLFLVSWLLFSMIVNAVGLPVPMLLGAVVAAVFMGAAWWWKGGQLDRLQQQVHLRLTPAGIEREDHLMRVEIPWPQVAGFERMNTLGKAASPHLGVKEASNLLVDAAGGASKRVEVALVGSGTLQRKPGLSAIWKETVRENYGIETDEPTPHDRVVVVPQHFEQDWRHGQIGRYLARHRPDLPVPATDDEVPRA